MEYIKFTNDIKKNMNEIKYIVKPEEGIVVGIMSNTKDIFEEIVSSGKCDALKELLLGIVSNICDNYPHEIKAIARVKDGDVFDPVIGKRIVEKKLYIKLHNRLAHQYSQLQDFIDSIMKVAENMESIHIDKAVKISEDYVNKYVKRETE